MKRKPLLFLLAAASVTGSCRQQESMKPSEKAPGTVSTAPVATSALPAALLGDYELAWEDNFDGPALDTAKWRYRAENTVRGHATILRSNVTMSDSGFVRLAARRNGDSFSASQLATHQTYLQKYGYFEARCRVNGTMGPHSAFWLQSPTMGNTLVPAVDGVEIDVFEYHLAEGPDIIRHNLHWDGYGANHKSTGAKETIAGTGQGFHTFGVEWTPAKYTFYVDGIARWSTTSAISRRSEFMLLSMEITGFGGNRFAGTYPDFLDVDYVKAYQLNKAAVYQHCTYGGWFKRLGPGNYTLSQLTALGIANDNISSISVPPGYSVTLYEHDNFLGNSRTVTGDTDCLDSTMNDKTSSIKVVKL